MILVKAYFNTDEHGAYVFDGVDDIEDLPICYYGPFDSISRAISWMENDYPDGDEDLHDMIADDFSFPEGQVPFINTPDSIFGDLPEEDIRPESQEIHGP